MAGGWVSGGLQGPPPKAREHNTFDSSFQALLDSPGRTGLPPRPCQSFWAAQGPSPCVQERTCDGKLHARPAPGVFFQILFALSYGPVRSRWESITLQRHRVVLNCALAFVKEEKFKPWICTGPASSAAAKVSFQPYDYRVIGFCVIGGVKIHKTGISQMLL